MIFSVKSILILYIKKCFPRQPVLKLAFLGEKYLKGASIKCDIKTMGLINAIASVDLVAVTSLCGIFRSRKRNYCLHFLLPTKEGPLFQRKKLKRLT